MDSLQTEDGQFFVRSLAQFIRHHEKALANSLQLSVNRRPVSQHGSSLSLPQASPTTPTTPTYQNTSSLATALSLAGLKFMSHEIKSAHLTLTPHHLFYLLSRIEDLGVAVGPMNVRIESIHNEPQSNYISFLQTKGPSSKGRSDGDSIHSVSSVRSVMSGMSAFWSSIGLGSTTTKTEKVKAAVEADVKYLYSAFTKLPSLRLTSDPRARLIKGYEEFPFDTAVPLFAFKNVQQLDIIDMDFRQFHGWDRLADQLCLLTVKRGNVDDLEDLITNIVLDDAERRRRRSNRYKADAASSPSWTVPSTPQASYARSYSDHDSNDDTTPENSPTAQSQDHRRKQKAMKASMAGSISPKRPSLNRPASSYRHSRTHSSKIKRSGSGSSNSSEYCSTPQRRDSTSNAYGSSALPASKWQRLKYLSLADNGMTSISARSIAPLAMSLRSLNLSSNLFNEIPDSLTTLTRLTSLDLSNCMIESLQSLMRSPLPAITTIKLKANRLRSLAGIERLVSLENVHVQDNALTDPMEAARLTGLPHLRRLWIKHNPMTKTYPNYRVMIMNLFRRTPGYTEDIIIDDIPATYAERKMLVPRVPEVEIFSRTLSAPPDAGPAAIQQVHIATDVVRFKLDDAIMLPNEIGPTPTKKKTSSRRRIVDLAARDEQSIVISEAPLTLNTNVDCVAGMNEQKPIEELHRVLSDTSELDLDPLSSNETLGIQDDQQHDDYRSRIEALRLQFGNNWLSALGGQNVHADHHFANESDQHSILHHSANPVIVMGGRSLG